jgi:hypothetical protein
MKGIPMIVDRRKKLCCLVTAVALLAVTAPAIAHHSFAMFDQTKPLTLSGTVTEFQWTNPHAYIEMDVADNGVVKHWSVEMGSPSILMQSGWKFKDLKKGDKVTVRLSPLKDGKPGGLLVQATLPDGRVLGNGPGRGPTQPSTGAQNQ